MDIIDQFSLFYTDLASMKVDELSNIYSQDIVFIDPIEKHEGIASVENYFTRLLNNAKFCTFTIHSKQATEDSGYIVTWTMKFTSKSMKWGKPISVDGLTLLKIHKDKIVYHRDYYDLGQMVYENIPVLGRLITKIKRSIG